MSIAALLFLFVIVLPFAAGVVLIILSRRRRGADHAACGQCGYNVTASIDSGSRCPECGAAFAQVGIVAPRGRRGRSGLMLGAGIALVVFAVGCFGSSIVLTGFRTVQSTQTAAPLPPPPAPVITTTPDATATDAPEGK